jgi:general secretion pathway protein B
LITTAEKKVIPFSDLPAALRQSIPDISIAFHQYSTNPAERRAMINNEVLRAGDQIAPGLLLEQITSDGVILSYAGYTFKRGVR